MSERDYFNLTRKSNMADKIRPKTEYSVAGDLLYRCLYFQLQENTYTCDDVVKVKFNLFKQLCSFACL